MYDLLWFVSLNECREKLNACESYGYGLDRRKIKKNLPTVAKTVERHEQEYFFWLDLLTYKMMRWEGIHDPLWTMSPRFEQEMAYDWWTVYMSYGWQGAKHEGGGD